MTRNLVSAALSAIVLTAAAPALAESEWVKVFDVEGDPKAAKLEVAGVSKLCDFHMMSRMGPDPRELAACEGAMKRLSARGAAAAPAILAALDREDVPYAARDRLYAALARTGDPAVADRMIDAMAKVATSGSERVHEASEMENVAETILRSSPEERAPWVGVAERDPYARLTQRVFAWRAHQRDNAGKTPDQRAAERLAHARADKAHRDLDRAYLAVRYLVSRDPTEGLSAAEALLERTSEAAPQQRDAVRRSIEALKRSARHQLEEAAAEAAAKAARGKAKGKPKAPPPPPPDRKKELTKADPRARS